MTKKEDKTTCCRLLLLLLLFWSLFFATGHILFLFPFLHRFVVHVSFSAPIYGCFSYSHFSSVRRYCVCEFFSFSSSLLRVIVPIVNTFAIHIFLFWFRSNSSICLSSMVVVSLFAPTINQFLAQTTRIFQWFLNFLCVVVVVVCILCIVHLEFTLGFWFLQDVEYFECNETCKMVPAYIAYST